MHIAHLARAENELLASLFEDELRFVLREDVRGAIVLLRQLLVPLQHIAGHANNHVVLVSLSVNRDGAECRAFDLCGLTFVHSFIPEVLTCRCGRTPLTPVLIARLSLFDSLPPSDPSCDQRAFLVLLGLASSAWEHGQLQHGRVLTFAQSRE